MQTKQTFFENLKREKTGLFFLAILLFGMSSNLCGQSIVIPSITNFTPKNGAPGTSVTITGANFNTTLSQNAVFLNGAKCTVTAATATSLTVTIPTQASFGAFYYSNFGTGMGCYSPQKFLIRSSSPDPGNPKFNRYPSVVSTASGSTVATSSWYGLADVNTDGKMDVFQYNGQGSPRGNAIINGSTTSSLSFTRNQISPPVVSNLWDINMTYTADFNNDGNMDFYSGVGGYQPGTVNVNNTTSGSSTISLGNFVSTGTSQMFSSDKYYYHMADVDWDGDLDMLSLSSGGFQHCKNNHILNGVKQAALTFDTKMSTNNSSLTMATPKFGLSADLNNDRKPDFITFTGSNTFSVVRNTSNQNSAGQFWTYSVDQSTAISGSSMVNAELVDLDGDGDLDLVTANGVAGSAAISVFYNQTSATSGATIVFGGRQDISLTNGVNSVSIFDFNGDGKPDILASSASSDGFYYIQNTSTTTTTATFAPAVSAGGNDGNNYRKFDILDLNSDGFPDIATSTGNGASFFQYQSNIIVTGSLTTFNGCVGASSASQSFTVSGNGLTANMVISAPVGMEISLSAASGYGNTITLSQSGGVVSNTTIYLRTLSTNSASNGYLGSVGFSSGTIIKTLPVFWVVREVPTVNSTAGASRCGVGTVVLNASVSTGTVEWYSALSGGTLVGTGSPFTTSSLSANTTFYVQSNNGGCLSNPRVPVLATINVASISGNPVMVIGIPATLVGSGTPAASNPWTSTNTSVATVNSSGVVTPVAIGNAVINYVSTTGCASMNISVDAATYYAKSSGSTMLYSLSNWSSTTNGTGPSPTGFRSGINFVLNNSANTTSFSLGTGINMEGNLVIPSGKVLNLPNYSTLTINGNLQNDGSIVGLSNSVVFFNNPTSQVASGNGVINTGILINGSPNITMNNSIYLATSLSTYSGSNLYLALGKVIQINGSNALSLQGNVLGSGILRLNGTTTQAISAGNCRISNLEVNNNVYLELNSTLNVDSSFLLSANKNFSLGPYNSSSIISLNINGAFSNLGNIVGYGLGSNPFSGSVVNINSAIPVELGQGTFFGLTLGANAGKVTCNTNSTINGNLTIGANRNFEIGIGKVVNVLGNIVNNGSISGLGALQNSNVSTTTLTGSPNSTISRLIVNGVLSMLGTNTILDSLVINTSRQMALGLNSSTYIKNFVQVNGSITSASGVSTIYFQNQSVANFNNAMGSQFWNLVVDSSSAGLNFASTVPPAGILNSIANNSVITFANGFSPCGQIGNSFTIRGNGTFPRMTMANSVNQTVQVYDSPRINGDFIGGYRKVILNNARLTVTGATAMMDVSYPVVTGNSGVFAQRVVQGFSNTIHIANSTTSGDYYPVIVSNNTGSNDEFSFTIRNNAYQNGTSGSNGNGVIPRTWVVSKVNANGGSGVNLSFTHLSNDSLASSLVKKVLFRFDGSNWVQVPGSFVNNAINNRTITINNYLGELNNTMFAIGDSATAFVRTKYYPVAGQSGNLHQLSSWRSNPNGTGNAPVSFGENCEFVLTDASNTSSFNLIGNWDLKGKLSIPVGKTLNLANNSTLNLSGDLSNLGDMTSSINSKLVLNGSANQIISGNVQLQNLEVNSGKTVTINGNVQVANQINLSNASALNIESTVSIQASVLGSNGTELRFSGSTAQTMQSSVQVGKITVNNANSVSFNGNVLTNTTQFINGKINIGNQNYFSDAFNGASSTSYLAIRGTGKINTLVSSSATSTLPVGGDYYSPVTITNNNAASDTFGIGFMDSVVKYGTSGSGISNQRNRVNQTWFVTKATPNVGGVNMTFNWNSSKILGGLSNPTLYRYSDTAWNLNTSGTSTASAQSLTISNFTDNLSTPFVIVDGATPLPVTWVGINAKWKMENHAILTWTTSMESNVNYFAIEKMNASKQFEEIGTTKAVGNSVQMQTYQFEDNNATLNSQVYRVTSVDFDGTRNSSALVVLSQTHKSHMAVFPNPCSETIMIQTEKGNSIEIFNLSGKLVHASNANQMTEEIDLSMLSSGIYFLKSTNGVTSNTIKLVKK